MRDRFDIKVVVSCPKAHEERGRVERRIRMIRDMLQKTGEPATTTTTSTTSSHLAKTTTSTTTSSYSNANNIKCPGYSAITTRPLALIFLITKIRLQSLHK